MRKRILLLFLTIIFINQYGYTAGIQIGRTRIIYDASKKEVALSLINTEDELPWLIQSWTDTGDEKTRGPFIITPPLFRLDAHKEQSLRITWTGAPLPTDRESLFYMNIRTIPASVKNDEKQNTLRMVYKSRFKIFWRPKDLPGSSSETCTNLRFRSNGGQLYITNDGAFYSVFDSLKIGSTMVKNIDMIAPKATITLPLVNHTGGNEVLWRCITDYGNASELKRSVLSQE